LSNTVGRCCRPGHTRVRSFDRCLHDGLKLTEDIVAINVREGAKRANEGVVALRRFRERLDAGEIGNAYVKNRFSDHVGRSFSRIKVYTDRQSLLPTASSPETQIRRGLHNRVRNAKFTGFAV
jgi:hypothetical protein